MTMFQLLNGNRIDEDMVETAMEDTDIANSYYLNTQNGEVVFFSDYGDPPEKDVLEDIENSDTYIPIERISSHEAYQWMEDFVTQIVAPQNKQVAEKLSIALMGKGAFRRFKDVLYIVGDEWVQAWYRWKDVQLKAAMNEWFESLSGTVTKEVE